MKSFNVHYGRSNSIDTAQLIPLSWRARWVHQRNPPEGATDAAAALTHQLLAADDDGPGVYAFCGLRDAVPIRHVLYIGKAEGQLSARVPTSVKEVLCDEFDPGTPLLDDVQEVSVHWARLESSLIADVERLFILAHSPPFNSQCVRKSTISDKASDLVVINTGQRGRLFSAVTGYGYSALYDS